MKWSEMEIPFYVAGVKNVEETIHILVLIKNYQRDLENAQRELS